MATANMVMNGEDAERKPWRAGLDHLQQRGLALAQLLDRDQGHSGDRDQNVDGAGDAKAGQHDQGEDPDRLLALLGHVHRVLEADHGEESERGGSGYGGEDTLAFRRGEL